MKKVFRNLCAVALAAGMLLPITACSSKNKNSGGSGQESETGKNSGYEDHRESSGKKTGEVRKLSKNQSRVIKETDPYFKTTIAELKPQTPEGKEIESAAFQDTFVVGDCVLANIHYELKKAEDVQAELNDMNLSDPSQWDRYQQIWDEHSYNSLQLFDLNGNNLATIPMDAEFSLNQAFPIGNDEILVVTHKMDWEDCTSVPKIFVISTSGKKLRDIDLGIDETLDHMKAYIADNGNLILSGRNKFYLFDQKGNLINKVEEQNLEGTMYCSNGKLYAAISYGQSDFCSFKEVDTKEGKLIGEAISIDQKDYIGLNSNMDCLIFSSNSVEQYDIVNGTRKELVTSVSADVNCAALIGGKVYSDDHMILIKEDRDEEAVRYDIYCSNENYNKMSIVTLDRAETNPNAGKEVLTLGICGDSECPYYDDIVAYNADPDSHARIEVVSYPIRSQIGYDVDDGIAFLGEAGKLLTEDMYSGKSPDIIVGFSDLAQLNNEDLMLNMKQYLDADSTLNSDDYFTNIFRAFEKDGKLFSIPVTYSLYGSAVNSFYEGAREKWTYEDLKTMDAKLPASMKSLPEYSCNELLTYWLYASDANFIDYDNRTVHFDSDEFKNFLQIIKEHGSNDRNFTSDIQETEESYIMGNSAARNIILSDLQDYCLVTDSQKGDKTLFTGYPSEKGMSICAKSEISMSVSAAASNPDLAWEFIRYFLNEDVQKKLSFNTYSLPVNRKAFNANCQKEIGISQTEYAEYERQPSAYGSEPRLFTQQDADGLAAVISSAERSVSIDSDILNVILTEADAYLYGFSSIDRVCGIIQLKATDIINNR